MKKAVLGAMVLLCMAPMTLRAGWGWGNKSVEEKKDQRFEQKQESRGLRETSREKSFEEKQAEIQRHREAQLEENKASQQAIHDKQMGELRAKLARNTTLTEDQKNEILAAREKQAIEIKAYGDQRRSENNAFFQNFANDPNMTEEQKREAIRAHFQSQKPADQAFRKQQKAGNTEEREKIRAGVPVSTNTVAQ